MEEWSVKVDSTNEHRVVYQYSSKQSKAFLVSLVNKPGWIPVKLTQRGVNRHYGKSIHSVVTTVAPYLVMDMIFTSTAMLQSAKSPTQVLDGPTFHHSLLSTLAAPRSQPEVSIFNVMKLKYFTEILKGK